MFVSTKTGIVIRVTPTSLATVVNSHHVLIQKAVFLFLLAQKRGREQLHTLSLRRGQASSLVFQASSLYFKLCVFEKGNAAVLAIGKSVPTYVCVGFYCCGWWVFTTWYPGCKQKLLSHQLV